MKKVHSVDYVIEALKILADNPYSLLWDLTEDFECNGHTISVKRSNQFQSVIIDGVYQHIGGNIKVGVNGGKMYDDPLDYVRDLLSEKKTANEKIDFGSGSEKEIREAIALRTSLNEDNTIKQFSPSSIGYKKLQAASELLSIFTGKDYYVDDTYFDYGQGWKWTTILCKDPSFKAVQALTPKDQGDILSADDAEGLGMAVDNVINKKPYTPQK